MANSNYKKVIALGLDYSEFQGGIKDCTDEMKKLDSEHKALSEEMKNTASKSDKLAETNAYLTNKIELQNKKLEIAKEKLQALKDSESATDAQIRRATTSVNNETAALARLQNELVETNVAMNNVKEKMAALVAVITAVGAAAISCVRDVADYADELQTLSAQTGVSIQTLQEWNYAADMIDTDFNTMTSALAKLEKTMANTPEVFRELGVNIEDASGHMRNAEDVFYETIDALGQIENATEQDQMAMQVFGKSAQELTGVINAGSSGLKELGNEAQALGVVLSGDEVQAAAKAKDAFDRLNSVLDAAKMKIGAELAPVLTAIANAIASVPAPVLATVAAIGALVAVVGTAIVAIGSVVKAFSNISSAVGLATGALNPNLLIILAIVAALALLAIAIEKIIQLYQKWRKEQEQLNKATQNLSENLSVSQGGGGHSRGSGNDHKASGGYARGGMTWVGENGPELVDLPSGSRVYNNHESKQIAGNTTYNISMSMDLSKMKSINDVVKAVQGLGMAKTVGV